MKRERKFVVVKSIKMDVYNAAASNLSMHVNFKEYDKGATISNHTHALTKPKLRLNKIKCSFVRKLNAT